MRRLEAVNIRVQIIVRTLRDEVLASLRRPSRHSERWCNRGNHTPVAIRCYAVCANLGVDILQNSGVGVI